ncbi:MAG TPA: FlgD immunoglobulin-like domain containing protein, partial [Bacteroidota bacterium]|nr:FlgD immunoglobulin-like domain containing protein [Bacteroidota bacterium]
YVTTARRGSSGTPVEVDLEQNYPNPFNPTTTITYSLKSKRQVVLKIFDSSGREIRRLVSEVQPMGDHKVVWDGTNRSGAPVASGIYFYRLQVDNTTVTKKALYIK